LTAIAAQRAPSSSAAGGRAGQLERWVPALAWLLTLLLVLATAEIVMDAAAGRSPLVPKSPAIAGWLSGLGERLGYRVFLIALLVLVGSYAGILALARRLQDRFAIFLVAGLHALVFVGPVLISTDVFSYIAYARMGVVHGINPYLHGPSAILADPVYRYVGHDWKNVATAYGPLYTLLSYPLAPLGVKGALWGMKTEALLASAGTLALVWRCARMRGLNPRFALLAVGANPLYFIYGLGGAHNDLVMILLTMAAVALVLGSGARRGEALGEGDPVGRRADRGPPGKGGARVIRRGEALGGAAVLAATLVKATGVVLLPFIVVSRRRLAPLLGAAGAAALGALVAYLVFGVHGIDLIAALNRDAAFVSSDSFPTEIAHLFGKPGVFPIDHDLLKAGLAIVVAHLLWRTWRGYDWVAASGWTLLAISVASTWLLAWYVLWPLPLAAVSHDRRLLAATLAVQALFVVHQLSPLLVPVS
jgi:alpha-1,6-mannosyltransferase